MKETGKPIVEIAITSVKANKIIELEDAVAVEEPLEIRLGWRPLGFRVAGGACKKTRYSAGRYHSKESGNLT